MASRYDSRTKRVNNKSLYSELFVERGVNFITQYTTPKFAEMEIRDHAMIIPFYHIWSIGDRYYKLADQHYDDPSYWWVIGWYNQRPLESDVRIGSVIRIPTPLDDVLAFFNRGPD